MIFAFSKSSFNMRAILFCCALFLSSAVVLAQDSASELMNRAYGLVNTNPDEAAKLLVRVTEIDPSNIAAHRQLGYIYLSKKNYDGALEQFQASEKIRSSD